MFELADRLVGIYKTYNCTKSVTVNPGLISAPSSRPCASQADPKARTQPPQSNPSQTNNQTLLIDH